MSRLSLMGERTGGIMKRLIIFLTVCTLLLAGCGGQEKEPVTESQSMENTLKKEETEIAEKPEKENTDTVKRDDTEADAKPDTEVSQNSTEETEKPKESRTEEKTEENTEKKETAKPDTSNDAEAGQEKEKEQPAKAPAEPEKPETVEYNPNEVVSLATAKTKAYGKISIPEDLDQMLAAGEITQAEHDEYYPYDGAGYYSVFVETDLNQAATTSGRKLGSVEGIADYIAEMLSLESGPYFYIEYAGVTSTGGTEYYEFRCYRA